MAIYFDEAMFLNDLNMIVGSGGEVIVKGPGNLNAPPMRLDVGDRLIGIGITHGIENCSLPPGPDAVVAFIGGGPIKPKTALRAFEVTSKIPTVDGFDFGFAPLSSQDYSETLATVTHGKVMIAPETIPLGAVILSFLDPDATSYTLQMIDGSPDENWIRATNGVRYWTVGMANSEDFWAASFPSDDMGMLSSIPRSVRVGSIRFGLSLLSGGDSALTFEAIPYTNPMGGTTHHHFVLSGAATGTLGINTPFPIGLRTEILCRPHES